MASYMKLVFLFILFIIFLKFKTSKAQDPNFLYQVCSKHNFTANSTYQANLRTLLSSLSSKATGSTEFFNNTVAGKTPSDAVYGLFMCRGDIPPQLCGQCVGNATHRLSTNAECILSVAAVMWYDECMVRYSNRSFFSTVAIGPGYVLASPTNMTNQQSFNRLLYDTLNKTADDASKPPVGAEKFATREANISIFQNLYCLAQCTPDLSPRDCRSCLQSLINSDLPRCCAGTQGGRVLYPNCNIRFEIYPFYRSPTSAPTPKPAGLVPPPNSAENKKGRSRTIILVVIPTVVSVTVFAFCCYFLKRKARKNKSKTLLVENCTQQQQLSWFERYKIIGGTALGILYLHEYSRLKVIHRDLKPSNILLDENMNPKISDFGMARIVDIDQDRGKTNRIVGTYGYMSPEYAMLGQFSEKSDVFSFGVMVLEITTGKKNASSYDSYHDTKGLLRHVWRKWKDQTPLSVLDPNMKENYSEIEVIKCIQIGLLCVQENPNVRPTMATVVSYLNNHSLELPSPQEPAFLLYGGIDQKIGSQQESSSGLSASSSKPLSVNEMSTSTFYPR